MRVNFAGMKSKTTHLVLASMIVCALALSVRRVSMSLRPVVMEFSEYFHLS